MGAATSQSRFDLSLCPQDCSGNCLGLACRTSHSCGYQDKCQQPQHFQCPPLVCPVLAHKPPPNQTAAGWRMMRGWSELVPLPAQLHDEPRVCQGPHHLFMFCCAQTISENPCLPKHHCWDTGLNFEPELSHSGDPHPEPAELPSECLYGEGTSTMASKKHISLLVGVPISLDTASQRAQAPPGVACPCNFPTATDLSNPGSLDSTVLMALAV